MTERQPRVWVLLGHRRGDNNQLLALAEALGIPFETRTLRFNLLRALHRFLGPGLISLQRESRRPLRPPWPDLVLGIGWRSVSVARWIERESGGRTKLVRLGGPRAPSDLFDLVITTPQYPVPDAPNLLRLPIGLSRFRAAPAADADEQAFLADLPRPHLLLAVGGAAKYWRLDTHVVVDAAARLARRGSLIAVTSPRTPAGTAQALEAQIGGRSNARLVTGSQPRFPVLLADADEIFVTGDSIAMLSEAVLSGKPVGIVPVELDALGRRKLADGSGRRDLRRFWDSLRDRGLAGTLDEPRSGTVEDPAAIAAAAVRALLGDLR